MGPAYLKLDGFCGAFGYCCACWFIMVEILLDVIEKKSQMWCCQVRAGHYSGAAFKGGVAQRLEQGTHNPLAESSILSTPTNLK